MCNNRIQYKDIVAVLLKIILESHAGDKFRNTVLVVIEILPSGHMFSLLGICSTHVQGTVFLMSVGVPLDPRGYDL